MSELADEVLMAYADNALDPASREAVEAAIHRQPEYRRKVDKYRATLAPLQNLFRAAIPADTLEPLAQKIRRGELEPTAGPTRKVSLASRSSAGKRAPSFSQRFIPLAMAASVALVLGGAIGWTLRWDNSSHALSSATFIKVSDGRLVAQSALRNLLERTGSGTPVVAQANDGRAWELESSFTFRSAGNLPCRRYEMRNEVAGRLAGYACRGPEGEWVVRAHALIETKAAQSKGFAPATGPAASDADAALEAAIRAASAGPGLAASQEKDLIARGWSD